LEYLLSDIACIISAQQQLTEDIVIEHLLLDSRRAYSVSRSLFFALKGVRRNGHQFIPDLYRKGVRNFVVCEDIDTKHFNEGNFLHVEDSLVALQQLAAHHRKRFTIPVIGITGSNGKTIVKEWLYHLLHEEYNIVRSPKSYNSQIGVPLSLWQMNDQHELGIFEAGISLPGEMEKLQKMILPGFGILTNIREAHNEGFSSMKEKALEKLKLFSSCNQVVYCKDHLVEEELDFETNCRAASSAEDLKFYSWSRQSPAWLTITNIEKDSSSSLIKGRCEHAEIFIQIPFTDDASVENAITCWATLLALGIKQEKIKNRMKGLFPVNMRLELKKGINHCTIINDSYSADLDSLQIALDFLNQQAGNTNKTVILSDFLQTGLPAEKLYDHIFQLIKKHNIKNLTGVGEHITKHLQAHLLEPDHGINIETFPSTDSFIRQFRSSQYKEETLLIK
jgi:alanine racemase